MSTVTLGRRMSRSPSTSSHLVAVPRVVDRHSRVLGNEKETPGRYGAPCCQGGARRRRLSARQRRLFARVAERYPRTTQAAEALYWQAWSLFRAGGSSNLSAAITSLNDLQRLYPSSTPIAMTPARCG